MVALSELNLYDNNVKYELLHNRKVYNHLEIFFSFTVFISLP